MGKLIDADLLVRDINADPYRTESEKSYDRCLVYRQPTVDAVEVVHGRWIEKIDIVASYLAECEEFFYECSVCNTPNFGESPYCPNCGAKRDGDGNG